LRVVEEPHFRSQQFMHISGTEVYNPKSVEGSDQLAPGPASGDGEQHTRRAAREAQLSKRGVARCARILASFPGTTAQVV
jgi:hypothetical protein